MNEHTENSSDDQTMGGVLRSIVQEYGAELYKKENASRFKALLSDLAVDFPSERKILGVVITEGVQERLLKAQGGTESEKQGEAAWCRLHLTEELGMAENRATEAVNLLAAGLGWSAPLSVKPEQPTANAAQSAAPQDAGQTATTDKTGVIASMFNILQTHVNKKSAQPKPQGAGKAAQPSPTAASGTETVVAADSEGNYTTLQDAINATAAGGTIRIKPGVYKGSVTLDKPLTITGMDGSIRDRASKDLPVLLLGLEGHLTITEQAAGARISGVVFTQFAERFANLVQYSAMRDDFDKNSTGERAKAVQSWDALPEEKRTDGYLAHIAGNVEFTNTALLCPLKDLCEISEGAPRFTDCWFGCGFKFIFIKADKKTSRNTKFIIQGSADPIMQQCSFGGTRLEFCDTAGGTYRDCDITAGGVDVIKIYGKSAPALERCTVHDNLGTGITVSDNTSPAIIDCVIHSNGRRGIKILDNAGPTIERCKIHSNDRHGISAYDSSKPTLRDCEIYENKLVGLGIAGSVGGTYEDCNIHDNVRAGIVMVQNARPTIERCKIHENGRGDGLWRHPGIDSEGSSKPTVRDCEIYGHWGTGIWIRESAGGTYENCKVYNNTKANVRNESSGSPVIRNC